MSVVGWFLVLCIIAVLLWLANTQIKLDERIRVVINTIVLVVILLWILNVVLLWVGRVTKTGIGKFQ
jgi:hypothetical protein